MIDQLALLVLPALLLAAAWTDARSFTIPNAIPLAVAAAFAPAALILGLSWGEIGAAALTGLAALAFMIALWAPGWIGGGDAKLIAAVALWFGWPDVMTFLLYTAAAGGVMGLAALALRRVGPALPGAERWLPGSPLGAGKPLPYAVAIAAGAFLALPSSRLAFHLVGA